MFRVVPLLLACATLALGGPAAPAPPTRSDGRTVRTWVVHFDAQMADAAVPTLRDLLAAWPKDARVLVGVTTAQDAGILRLRLGLAEKPDPRIEFLPAGLFVSGWARDRYIVFEREGRPRVLVPAEERVAPHWMGDLAVGRALRRWAPELELVESRLSLEGGNVLLTPERVLVGPQAVVANMDQLRETEAGARAAIEEVFGRELLVVGDDESPLAAEHVDMYLAVAGPRKLLLGDPRLATEALEAGADPVAALGKFEPATQAHYAGAYDAIARQLEEEGFELVRLPILHSEEGVIVTWTNAVTESRDGKEYAYVPTYGLPRLDEAAVDAWRELGFEVHEIAAEGVIVLGGGVRCVTNTLPAGAPRAETR